MCGRLGRHCLPSAALHGLCVRDYRLRLGCDCKTPNGVEIGQLRPAHRHRLKRRKIKDLQPSRRLSESTGPRSSSAFRVVVRGPRQQIGPRSGSARRRSSHMAHRAPGLFPQRRRFVSHVPAIQPTRCTCSRKAAANAESTGIAGDSVGVHLLPRAQRSAAHTLPRR